MQEVYYLFGRIWQKGFEGNLPCLRVVEEMSLHRKNKSLLLALLVYMRSANRFQVFHCKISAFMILNACNVDGRYEAQRCKRRGGLAVGAHHQSRG